MRAPLPAAPRPCREHPFHFRLHLRPPAVRKRGQLRRRHKPAAGLFADIIQQPPVAREPVQRHEAVQRVEFAAVGFAAGFLPFVDEGMREAQGLRDLFAAERLEDTVQ